MFIKKQNRPDFQKTKFLLAEFHCIVSFTIKTTRNRMLSSPWFALNLRAIHQYRQDDRQSHILGIIHYLFHVLHVHTEQEILRYTLDKNSLSIGKHALFSFRK